MKVGKGAACGAVLSCVSGMALAQQAAPVQVVQGAPVLVSRPTEVVSGSALPSNSEVWMSLDRELNSKKAKVGDKFDMTVSRDVMLGNYIVIPKGTRGHGQVSYRTGKGAFGKSGKMEFDLLDVQMADRFVPLSGHYRIEGQGNTGATVGALVAVGVFSAFVKGHSASAAQGSEWKSATKEPLIVQFADQRQLVNASAAADLPQAKPIPATAQPAVVEKTK